MRVQLSLFPMDLDAPSAREPASEVVIAPEHVKVKTLSPLIAHEPQAQETSQLTVETDDQMKPAASHVGFNDSG